MKLECFRVGPNGRIVASSHDRQWMDAFASSHPYRCLPLTIANSHGWDILNPLSVEITWNGGPAKEDLKVRALDPQISEAEVNAVVRSNFSRGIVTFHTGFLFRTEPRWDLLVMGPINRPKLNLYPLTAVIETDWLPYPFTMNWQLLAAGTYIFAKDEPLCTLMPLPHNYLPEVEPEIYNLGDDEVLDYEHQIFRRERTGFMERFRAREPAAIKQAWQRHYFLGRFPNGAKVDDHVNKMRLSEPVDRTGQRPSLARTSPRAESETIPWADRQKLTIVASQPAASFGSGAGGEPKGPPQWRFPRPSAEIPPHELERYVSGEQSTSNFQGRRRVIDGVLATIDTDHLPPECGPADDLDFVLIDDIIDQAECAAFCEAYRSISGSTKRPMTGNAFWAGRVVSAHELIYNFMPLARRMKELCHYSAELIGRFYNLQEAIYADSAQLVCWPEGMHMRPHADNANPGGEPHGMAWRKFSSVLYLNGDYEGGELYLTALNKIVRPKSGRLIAFTGGFHHEHAVLKIKGGNRYTMPAFFTNDEDRANEFLYS
jgi:Family of unknown function (DUF6065)/2OG-Fe(II) oxygenase superfamily